jgi:hypothetical protein
VTERRTALFGPVATRRVLIGLLVAVSLIALLAVAAAIVRNVVSLEEALPGGTVLQQQFYVDNEINVPTWYSSTLLLASAFLAGFIALVDSQNRSRCRRWVGLAAMFVVLSMDETASMHETVNSTLRDAFGFGGVWYFAWLVPGVVAVAVVGFVYLGFVWRLPRRTRRIVVVAGVTFLVGAVGMEMVGGVWADAHGVENLRYGLMTSLEEVLEMLGVSLFIYGLMVHLEGFSPLWLVRELNPESVQSKPPGPGEGSDPSGPSSVTA